MPPLDLPLRKVGTERINCRRVPVFLTTDGVAVVRVIDSAGTEQYIDAQGAILLKNGPYPLCPTVAAVYKEEMQRSPIPFRFRTLAERDESTDQLLHALATQMISVRRDEKSFLAAA